MGRPRPCGGKGSAYSKLHLWMTVTAPPRASGTPSASRSRYHPMTRSAKLRATAPDHQPQACR